MSSPVPEQSLTLRWPWWIRPTWALMMLTGAMVLLSILLPAKEYTVWLVPKYLTENLSLILVILVTVMWLGIYVRAFPLMVALVVIALTYPSSPVDRPRKSDLKHVKWEVDSLKV